MTEDDKEEAAEREALHEIRTRRGRIGGPEPAPATVNGEMNNRTEPSAAELTAGLQVMEKAFGCLILGIVLLFALKFLF